ncbi:Fic family protein [Catonella morbi ATCC 51271]|uniref:Fic family protein n=1 Tax=Catonella morbi ATCC 51271 TaxID=592026 RepID=V2Y2K1_9FIRM|nr:Fic family protein [Catonella morbi]ESL02287.1 Fic family protein [Catonella morbi ATCC 51271]
MVTDLIKKLKERLFIEFNKRDRSGIYAVTSRKLAYNSNKIEGSTLTENQTASLFDTGLLPVSDNVYRAKDIEEMNGHFLMFNHMLKTLDEDLSEELIKKFHYELKSGVFEDKANGYNIGEYKARPNIAGTMQTSLPVNVSDDMKELLIWYKNSEKNLRAIALFHLKYEKIHPFQDGNGRTGRVILFREALKNDIIPPIIHDENRVEYIEGIKEYSDTDSSEKLLELLMKEQNKYMKTVKFFLE